MDSRRRRLFQPEPLLGVAPLHAALRRARNLSVGVRRDGEGEGSLPPHHAPALYRPPLAHRAARPARHPHQERARRVVRDPPAGGGILQGAGGITAEGPAARGSPPSQPPACLPRGGAAPPTSPSPPAAPSPPPPPSLAAA